MKRAPSRAPFSFADRYCPRNISDVHPFNPHLHGVRIMETFITTSLSGIMVAAFILFSGIGLQ